jgi:hypothetical protein
MGTQSLQFPGLDAAIAHFEDPTGTGAATRANNPGAIQYGQYALAHGAVGANGSLAIFPDSVTGTSAEDALIQNYANQGVTVSDMINSWAPPNAPGNSPQSTNNYVQSVANTLGVPSTTPVSQLAGVVAPPGGSTSPTQSQSLLGKVVSSYLNPGGGPVTWGRVGAFLLGLILIVAGLYLFKPPATFSPGPIGRAVNKVTKKGAKYATRATVAAI